MTPRTVTLVTYDVPTPHLLPVCCRLEGLPVGLPLVGSCDTLKGPRERMGPTPPVFTLISIFRLRRFVTMGVQDFYLLFSSFFHRVWVTARRGVSVAYARRGTAVERESCSDQLPSRFIVGSRL